MIYPFTAIVGQDPLKNALVLNVVDPGIGGVLIRGEKGTAKSTAVRALADLLPPQPAVAGCPFGCAPPGAGRDPLCPLCRDRADAGEELPVEPRPTRVVELPLGATEDRLVGTLDIEHALQRGEKRFEPGLLARAHRSFLYVDEVNLLEDHLVDLLLDAAAMGVNTVEREGVSFTHPARFTLVGTMNPEEGELRPQLLDRFGLCVQVSALERPEDRIEVLRRLRAFEDDPAAFHRAWAGEQDRLRDRILRAREALPRVEVDDGCLEAIVTLASRLHLEGHRAEIVMMRACRALAALEGADRAGPNLVRRVAPLALAHRMRRQPFEDPEAGARRLQEALEAA